MRKDRQTDRQVDRHDKANFHFSHLTNAPKNVSHRQTDAVEKIKTHISCSLNFSDNRAVYEIMWENTVDPGRPQMTKQRMRFAC